MPSPDMSNAMNSVMQTEPMRGIFAPMLGLPGWNVMRGQGSMLTFEFGEPTLSIREPVNSPSPSPKIRGMMGRRRVSPVGEWCLWIYLSNWSCLSRDRQIASSEASAAAIDQAARVLDGQRLISIEVDPDKGSSAFTFDLGGRLETWPYPEGNDEQWSLSRRDGAVFSYRKDGCYCLSNANTLPDEERWLPWPVAVG
jgi:hypothetical protein